MHFAKPNDFIIACFKYQQLAGFDRLVSTHWLYDELQFLGQVTLLDPFFETSKQVTVACTQEQLDKLVTACNHRYSKQVGLRWQAFRKPTTHVMTEYDSWSEYYETWLNRSSRNVTSTSLPLLFDTTELSSNGRRSKQLYITQYVTKSREFYRFTVNNFETSYIRDSQQSIAKLIKEAYV